MTQQKRHQILVLSCYQHADEMRGIANFARKQNWSVRFITTSRTKIPNNLNEDGIIIIHNYQNQELVDYIQKSDKPKVSIGRKEFMTGIPFVSQHLEEVGKAGADYFLKAGFKNLTYPLIHKNVKPEYQAFKNEVEKAGRIFHEVTAENLKEKLQKLPKPLALMAADDDWAVSIYSKLEKLNIAVPEEVSLLGASNNELTCELNFTPISSLDLRYDELGFQAASLLEKMLNDEPTAEAPILIKPGKVIVRDSTSAPPIDNIKVAQVVRKILTDFRKPIVIEQLAESVNLCRWSLDVAFKKSIGETVAEYIQNCRITEAEKLLKNSELKINEIARKVGYLNHVTFLRAFHRIHNCSPTQFRQL